MFSKRCYGFSFKLIFLSGLYLISTQALSVDIVNVSTRGVAGQEERQLVVGFVVEGSGRKQVMITGTGPSADIPETIENPAFIVFDQETGKEVYSCDDWKNCLGSNIVQAFLDKTEQIITDSEAAATLSFDAGAYSIEIRDADGDSGIALGAAIEIPTYVASDNVSFGTWQSEDGSVCFNVVFSELTPKFSGCPEGASLIFELPGKTASGDECMISSFTQQTIPIKNGQIYWAGTITGGADIETFSAVFMKPRFGIGTVTEGRKNTPLSEACIAEWSAIPSLVKKDNR